MLNILIKYRLKINSQDDFNFLTSCLFLDIHLLSGERDNSLKKLKTSCSFILILCLTEIDKTDDFS